MSRTTGDVYSDEAGRMKPDIKLRWCAALRSGRYEQLVGQPFLARVRDDGVVMWNALGVLCDVMSFKCEPKKHGALTVLTYDGADSYLTPRNAARCGIGPKRGAFVARIYIDHTVFTQGYDIKNLSSAGVKFEQIANIIEEQL